MWFGVEEEHPPNAEVSFIINNGTINLTGGTIPQNNDIFDVAADLAFFYAHDGSAPYNEKYELNFRGPGSLTVDTAGIKIFRLDPSGVWNTDAPAITYEELWNAGILKSKGMSGGYYDPSTGLVEPTNQAFSSFFTTTNSNGQADYKVTRKDPTVVTWDGGTGEWNDNALWNGGQTAATVFGRTNGSGGGHAIVIDGSVAGGANVSYDGNAGSGTNSDFRLEPNGGVSSMTIKNGGVFSLQSADDIDGVFTRWGGDLTVDGAGSKFVRTKALPSFSGGAWMLGAFSQKFNQEIDVVVSNGGRIENDGELYFGGDGGENAAGLEVTITINGGSIDLRGGDAIEGGFGPLGNGTNDAEAFIGVSPSLAFLYTLRPAPDSEGPAGLAGEKYSINFTGPGSITVDHAGIYYFSQDESGVYTAIPKTYQQLWDDGVLQANGLSGLQGSTFGDHFSVNGAFGMDNYRLTSLIAPPGVPGDYNNNGTVDAADYVLWRNGGALANDPTPGNQPEDYNTWRANFGNTAGSGAALPSVQSLSAAVPEPSALALAGMGVFAFFAYVRSRTSKFSS